MWINKFKSNLYAILVSRMFIALFVSFALFVFMISSVEFLVRDNVTKLYDLLPFVDSQKTLLHQKAFEIQEEIINEELTIEATIDKYSIVQDHIDQFVGDASTFKYLIILMMKGRNELDRVKDGYTDDGIRYQTFGGSYIFEIHASDSVGYLFLSSRKADSLIYVVYIGVFITSISMFFVLSLKFVKPVFNYIKDVEEGVKLIAKDDFTHRIELKGNHELTNLASEINDMGLKIYEKTENEKIMDKNQRLLITNISHDIRTPLTSIIGYLDLIEGNVHDPEIVKTYLETTKSNAERLEKLVNDLFLYTKLTSGDISLNMTKVDINILVKQMVELKNDLYHVTVPSSPLYANLDINKFLRVLENLFSNAEKYGVKDETIRVSTYDKDHEVCIAISNLTTHDLSDKMSFLMDRLYVANVERKQGSSGLGLSIVKALVEQMHGDITLDYHQGEFTALLIFSKA